MHMIEMFNIKQIGDDQKQISNEMNPIQIKSNETKHAHLFIHLQFMS